MKNELKVGQEFRVFDSNNYYGELTPKWFAERNDEFYGCEYGVNSCGDKPLHFNFSQYNYEKVGLLRITKLK